MPNSNSDISDPFTCSDIEFGNDLALTVMGSALSVDPFVETLMLKL